MVLNSKTGMIIWSFEDPTKDSSLEMDVYTGLFIPDQNDDNFTDVLCAHTAQKEHVMRGHLLLISGRDGKLIKKVSTPGEKEIFYTPQLFNSSGELLVLFGTGSPNSPGNLSVVSLQHLLAGNMVNSTLHKG